MCRWSEKIGPTIWIPRIIHFVGYFNVSVQTPTPGHAIYDNFEKQHHFSRLFRRARGYGGPIPSSLTLGGHYLLNELCVLNPKAFDEILNTSRGS